MLFPKSPGPPTSVLPDQCGLPPSQAETGSNPRDPKSFSKEHKFDGVLSCFLSNQITMLWASPFSDTPSLKDPKHARLAMAESLWVQSAHGHLHCQCPEPACGTSKSKSSNMAGKSPINATKSAFKWENHPKKIGDFPGLSMFFHCRKKNSQSEHPRSQSGARSGKSQYCTQLLSPALRSCRWTQYVSCTQWTHESAHVWKTLTILGGEI